jgi:hypothetical protein
MKRSERLLGILPNWVEPDPLRSRATDALGLQAVADRLADRLLPGLSVLTTRARYFTFLSWARDQVGVEPDERKIHRWEVALALAEASISDDDRDHATACSFVGSRNVVSFPRNRVPRDPRTVYRVPAWRAYRASMIDLGLIKGGPRFALEEQGAEAAARFRSAVRHRRGPAYPLPPSACLSEVSRPEQQLVRNLLGISVRGRIDEDSTDARSVRAAFAKEVRHFFRRSKHLSPETVLPMYETRKASVLPEPAATLRVAAVWERLSLGLNVLFMAWVRGIERGETRSVERKLEALLRVGLRCPPLSNIDLEDDHALGMGVACLREALRRFDVLADRGVEFRDGDAFELVRCLLGKGRSARSRVEETMKGLQSRHKRAKGDEVWVREIGHGELELAREPGDSWQLPRVVRLHAYRMSAFGSIARDVGGI